MRFHIGFSKFIKPSRLLYWLGLGFIGLLAWVGLAQQEVLASTTLNSTFSSYSSSYVSNGMRKTTYNGAINTAFNYSGTFATHSTNQSLPLNYLGFSNQYVMPFATSQYYYVFHDISWNITLNPCSNIQDTNSLDIYYSFKGASLTSINTKLQDFGYTSASSISDVLTAYVQPVYQEVQEGPPVEYACNISADENDANYYNVVCIGIPVDNVISYKLLFYNNLLISLNNDYSAVNHNTMGQAYIPAYGLYDSFTMQCSYVEPVQPDEPLFPEDASGNSNISIEGSSGGHCFGEDCASSEVNSSDLYTSWVNDIDINEGLQDLIILPKRIIDTLVNESGETCTPISINFSSFTRRFGANGGFDYSLQLPCMRTTLSTLLNYQIFNGITIYNLFDLLMGFGLLIVFANRFHGAINNILSGDSLTEYTDL